MASFDVIVIGLGGMGSAAAAHLAARGQRVLGLEQYQPAHALGSSHGRSRVIRLAYFEHPSYVPLLLRAYELWEQLERDSGRSLLTITGGLMIGTPDSDVVSGSLRSARAHGLAHELLDAAEIRRRFPPFTPQPGEVALYEERAGVLRPESAIHAHLEQANRHGAELRFDERVLDWRAQPSGEVEVRTTRGSHTAARLVLAPGAWAPEMFHLPLLPLEIERQVLYWFAPPGGTAPFAPERFPIYIWDRGEGVQFYGFPAEAPHKEVPYDRVKVAFFRTGGGARCTADTIDRVVHPDEVGAMRDALAPCIPLLSAGNLVETVTCMYTLTPDHHFVIGPHPNHPQVVIASPCSGHGYKFATVVGEILADLAIDGTTRHPIDLFSPRRF
ncbi:MAG: N-methyl-L-tryptophan oxidase [Acidobacteriota bacterium]|nr:N-methyl-L-tryptophan oxidase [Acidobacteriota bacterium]